MHPDRLVAIMSGTSYLTTASCIVFVGNIPYGLSETQITDIFNSVGRVVCFRMVFDRETGRSKGYGFAEYIDAETAASAVRNLDNYEIMGRKLRVDYSSQGYVGKEGYPGREGYTTKESAYAPKDSYPTMVVKDTNYPTMVKDTDYNGERIVYSNENGYINVSSSDNSRHGIPGTATMNCNENGLSARYGAPKLPALPPAIAVDILIPPSNTSSFPMLPLGVESHPNLTTPDSISKTLATVPPSQLLRILIQMKELATTDPATATELLRQCPQLSYAIFQSMIMMNLIEPGVLSQLLEPSNSTGMYTQHHPGVGSHIPPKAPHQASGMPHQPSSMLHQPTSRQATPHVPTATQQANFYNYQTQHSSLPTHNTHPEFANRIAQQQQMQGMQEPDKAMLLQRVMVLTQEEISRLPTEQQQQVLLLKHRLMTEGMSGHGQQGF